MSTPVGRLRIRGDESVSEKKGSTAGPRIRDLSDEELDTYILARLRMLGVDLSVLPEDDPDAPADRRRILRSARNFLRYTIPAIADFELPLGESPPVLYPVERTARTGGLGAQDD